MRRIVALATLLVLAAMPLAGQAATCSASATGPAFGTYLPSSPIPGKTTGTVTVTCSNLLPEAVSYAFALGTGGGGSFAGRRMSNGTALLTYQLYQDSALTQPWGDGTSGTTVVAGTCTVVLLTCTSSNTVYGAIPIRQAPTPGGYTDSVVATLTYTP